MYHLSAVYNLLHGKGWTNSFYYINNINKEVTEPFCFWPPGYGILLTPFQLLFGNNFYLSTSIFEIICFCAFILLCRAILKTQGLSRFMINIATLLLSFASYDFIEASLGTDLPGLCFVLGFFYCNIRIWKAKNKKELLIAGIGCGICLSTAAFIRYMYMPVCVFAVVVSFIVAWVWKKRIIIPGLALSFIIGGIGILCTIYFQNLHCGSPFYLGPVQERGFYFSNLRYWHPAILFSFFDINFLAVQLEKYTNISFGQLLIFFSWINIILYIIILIKSSSTIKKIVNPGINNFSFFSFYGFIISASIIGELAFLSFTTAPQISSGYSWTFLAEGRYFAFVVVFIQLYFFLNYKKGPRYLSYCLFAVMLLNSIHQVYFTTKVITRFTRMKKEMVREQDYVFFDTLFKRTINEYPGKEILVAASDKYFPLLASVYNKKGIADSYHLNEYLPSVKSPCVLMTVIGDIERENYSNYLARKDIQFAGKAGGKSFYIQLLAPVAAK